MCPKGVVHNLLVQLFTLGNSKIEVFETYFFDTVIISNDHPRYVKHVFGRIYEFVMLFSYWVRGADVPRDWSTTCLCSFSHWAAHKSKFLKHIFYDTVII